MIKKIRQRRAQKPRLASLSISRSWKFAGIRIATTIFLLGIILYAAFAERIPLIGASCNEPESLTTNNLNPTNQKVPILTSADSTKAVVNFRSIIQNLIDAEGIASNSKTSIRILTIKQHEVLFEKNPHQYLTPASTTKLFPSFSAFYTMGSDYMIPTQVLSDGMIENGVLKGDIYLKGFGDALLDEQDITALVLQLKQKGITSINGGIYADASYFDNITQRHIYSGDNEVVEPLAPITALGIHKNEFIVDMVHGQTQIIPASDAVFVNRSISAVSKTNITQPKKSSKNKIISKKTTIKTKNGKKKVIKVEKSNNKKSAKKVTKNATKKTVKKPLKKSSKKRSHAWWKIGSSFQDLQRNGDAPKAPKRKKKSKAPISRISIQHNQQGLITVNASGKGTSSATYTMKYPDIYAAGVLSSKLRLAGIHIQNGLLGRKSSPSNAKTIAEFKRPLAYMISLVNKNSDNFLAEHVYKMVGAYAGGHINTGKVATETVKNALSQCGIPVDGLCINDGSGLCRKNLFSAYVQTMLLEKAINMKFGEAFKQTLSIAGVDGTLRKRMVGTYAENNLCAKTGTLRNTSALSGYANTKDGDQVVFSIINNGPNVSNYKQLENKIGAAIANFSYQNYTSTGVH
ncbi:MAG: D-alanyl-D-alanine carboxypeptidase/D-alanyl-D-alanine endopeptidase [Bacteroidota bacterium]